MENIWKKENNTLSKTFIFKDFAHALVFINKVAAIAEQQNHHPDIGIKNYNQVHISTNSHDASDTITEKDYALTEAIDQIV